MNDREFLLHKLQLLETYAAQCTEELDAWHSYSQEQERNDQLHWTQDDFDFVDRQAAFWRSELERTIEKIDGVEHLLER